MTRTTHLAGTSLALGMLALALVGLRGADDFAAVAGWFPRYASIAVMVLALGILFWELGFVGSERDGGLEHQSSRDEGAESSWYPAVGFWRYVLWLIAFGAMFQTFGIGFAVIVWLTAFRRFDCAFSWRSSLVGAIAAAAVVGTIVSVLGLRVPDGTVLPNGLWIVSL